MINLGKDVCLTDELERQLMRQAIEEQYRFKPGLAIKNMMLKLAAVFASSKASTSVRHADVHVAQNNA